MIKKIAPDKWRHFFAGIVLGIMLQAFLLWLLSGHPGTATGITFVLVAVISYGFELFSKVTGKGYYEVLDAVATTAGALLGMAFTWLARLYF